MSEPDWKYVVRRNHVEQAIVHLKCALNTYHGETEDYAEVERKVNEFIEYLYNEAPGIA